VIVRIDPSSTVPPYEQLRVQIAASIHGGTLEGGRRLPPIRQLAADLDLAPGTVARAYRELEAAGLVESRGRRGTRVVDVPPAPVTVERDARLAQAADEFALRAAELGADLEEATAALHAALVSRAGGAG
jgi:GntR family transcriptional regulator